LSLAASLPEGRRGQAWALGMTAVALALLWFGAVAPALAWFADRDDLLSRRQAFARRAAALVETLPALRRQAEELTKDNADAQPLLTGSSDAVAAATLQQKIDELAASAGLRLASEEILPARPAGALRAIAVRVTVTASWKGFVALLLALSSADIPMSADDIQLRRPPTDQKTEGLPIDVTFTVTSWRLAKSDGK
jgi:general secretion pathway protein M